VRAETYQAWIESAQQFTDSVSDPIIQASACRPLLSPQFRESWSPSRNMVFINLFLWCLYVFFEKLCCSISRGACFLLLSGHQINFRNFIFVKKQ